MGENNLDRRLGIVDRLRWLSRNVHKVDNLGEIKMKDGFGLIIDFDGVFLWRHKEFGDNLVNLFQVRSLAKRASWVIGKTGRWVDEGRSDGVDERISSFPVITKGDLVRLGKLLGADDHPVSFETGLEKLLGKERFMGKVEETLMAGRQVLVVGSGVFDLLIAEKLSKRSGGLSEAIHFFCIGSWFSLK